MKAFAILPLLDAASPSDDKILVGKMINFTAVKKHQKPADVVGNIWEVPEGHYQFIDTEKLKDCVKYVNEAGQGDKTTVLTSTVNNTEEYIENLSYTIGIDAKYGKFAAGIKHTTGKKSIQTFSKSKKNLECCEKKCPFKLR